jgi:benzylsuccinate CoA-transferase BbsE subunit
MPDELRQNPQALGGLRVVEISGPATAYCGKLFADLGAEVTLIEPTAGAGARCLGPFFDDRADIEGSLSFAYFNAGKKSVCLDLDLPAGQAILRELCRGADVLIEGERPGTLAARGLGHEALQALNPKLITTSITPFGQTGPYADYHCEDIVAMALGGFLYLGGYPQTEPIAAHGFQAYMAGAQMGAVATMMALTGRDAGLHAGTHVDVSIQESVVLALENAVQFYDLEGTVRRRHAGDQRQAGMGVFPCRDGQVFFMAGGVASNRFWQASVQWLTDEGAPNAEQLQGPQWLEMSFLQTEEAKRIFASVFEPFAMRHTKAELYAMGQGRRLPICPISTPADLTENRQLQARGHFVTLDHPATQRSITVPGAPYVLSETPWRLAGPAPRLGEHTAEVIRRHAPAFDGEATLLQMNVVR